MAFALRFAVIALVASNAVQVYANNISISFETPLGQNSINISTGDFDLSKLGGEIKLQSNGKSQEIELGLPGGFQANLIVPLLPQFDGFVQQINKASNDINNNVGNIIKNIQKNLGNAFNEAQHNFMNFLKNPIKAIQQTASKANDDLHNNVNNVINGNFSLCPNIQNILPKANLNLPGIGNLSSLVENAGGFLNKLEDLGEITQEQLINISSSVIASGLNNTENSLAKLNDILEAAVKMSLLTVDQSMNILLSAVNQGLQSVTGTAEDIVDNFLKSAQVLQTIGFDTVSELTALAVSLSETMSNGISDTLNADSDNSSSSESDTTE